MEVNGHRPEVLVPKINAPIQASDQAWALSEDAEERKVEDKKCSGLLFLRVTFILLITVAVYISKNHILPTEDTGCIKDKVLDALGKLNQRANTDITFRKGIQVSSSFLMDFVYIVTAGNWAIRGNSMRFVFSALLFYGIRAILMGFSLFTFPAGYVWDDPGVPSIVVPYGRTSDFFFSGHCGFLVICAAENFTIGLRWFGWLTHCINVYMALIMLICRIHYTIDIFTGVIFGHYVFIVVSYLSPKIDGFFVLIWSKFTKSSAQEKVPFLYALDEFPPRDNGKELDYNSARQHQYSLELNQN
eukprot:TRINITY_DN1352_c0_g1_i1.p1 TRINITY_DN1352_c0_g1~~TRINITY_DN1352_c0_g1_i1.p1  ORF type:complete len:302 (-),score=20.12 TRINITY_DN1352_c0_g1_i1:145-1050(-)